MRHGVNTILPGRLYQRAEFLKWTHDEKHEFLEALGVDVIVNLWGKVDPDLSSNGQPYIYIVWPISSSDITGTGVLVNMVGQMIAEGHKVLVHCEAGVNRSAWFCARLLIWLREPEPWATVKAAVPRAGLRPVLLNDMAALGGLS